MGFGMTAETLVPKLTAAGLLAHKSFAMCFAGDGGTLALGGAAPHLHSSEMEFAYLHQMGLFWGVTFKDLLIDGTTIGAASAFAAFGSGSTIVDSGTTYTYIPTSLQAAFKVAGRGGLGPQG